VQRVVRVGAVVNFRPTLFSPLLRCLSELAIRTLQVLLSVLIYLGLINVAIKKRHSVGTVAPVALHNLFARFLKQGKVVHAADVPVAHTIELDPAHVGAAYLADLFAVLLNPARDVVAPLFGADRVLRRHAVLLVLEVTRSAQAMDEGAP